MQKIIELTDGLEFGPIRIRDLIACGDYGCAFTTSQDDVVVKIGTQWSEYRFALRIISDKLSHPSLPIVYGALDMREALEQPFYALIREDIPDLHSVDAAWFNEVLADLEYAIDEEDTPDYVFSAAAEILESRPGTAEDELKFEQVAELTAWCLERGILLGDTLANNFGEKNGQIKLRDLGGARFLV